MMSRQGITLNPPTQAVAEEFNVKWDPSYWGDETPIYATYGAGTPAGITSMWSKLFSCNI